MFRVWAVPRLAPLIESGRLCGLFFVVQGNLSHVVLHDSHDFTISFGGGGRGGEAWEGVGVAAGVGVGAGGRVGGGAGGRGGGEGCFLISRSEHSFASKASRTRLLNPADLWPWRSRAGSFYIYIYIYRLHTRTRGFRGHPPERSCFGELAASGEPQKRWQVQHAMLMGPSGPFLETQTHQQAHREPRRRSCGAPEHLQELSSSLHGTNFNVPDTPTSS